MIYGLEIINFSPCVNTLFILVLYKRIDGHLPFIHFFHYRIGFRIVNIMNDIHIYIKYVYTNPIFKRVVWGR